MLTRAKWEQFKSDHGAVAHLKAEGIDFVVRMPTLDELSFLRHKDHEGKDRTYRKFARACTLFPEADEFDDLMREKPGLVIFLVAAIFRTAGGEGGFEVLEESELEGDLAKAYVAEKAKDFPGSLYPIRYQRKAIEHVFILREFRQPDFAEYKANFRDVHALKRLVKRCAVWGNTDAFERDAPALYCAVVEFLAQKAGLAAEFAEGEFDGS